MTAAASEIALVVFLGLVLGSFATALVWRIPRGLSWVRDTEKSGGGAARSACVSCGKRLKLQDLIPVFSWLLLRGRCRYCGAAIGIRYPAIELLVLFGCLGLYASWGMRPETFILMALIPILAALMAIDFEHFLLPDQLVFIAFGLACFFILYQGVESGFDRAFLTLSFQRLLAGIVFGGLVFLVAALLGRFLKKEALGFGDVKFLVMAGMWVGLSYLPFFLIFSGLAGVLIGGWYRIFWKNVLFPFGPALILALYTCLLLMGRGIVPLTDVH